MQGSTPTVYEWAGGQAAFDRLTDVFYRRVRDDEILGPVFAGMDEHHPQHVATWLAEVFGGPPRYTEEHGGYPHMLHKHLGLAISETQRRRWVTMIMDAADEAELPVGPGVPVGVRGLRRVGHAARARQLAARRRAAARGARAALGLGRGAAVPGLRACNCTSRGRRRRTVPGMRSIARRPPRGP